MLAEALFERIEVLGMREVTFHLTETAQAHGFGAVLPDRLWISVSGRGERIRASVTQVTARPRPAILVENVTGPPKVWPDDFRKAG